MALYRQARPDELLKKEALNSVVASMPDENLSTAQKISTIDDIVNNTAQLWLVRKSIA